MRFRRRPDHPRLARVATIAGRGLTANAAPRTVGARHAVFPGGLRVHVDGDGGVNITSRGGVLLRIAGPAEQ